jgi:hypothetical protein
MAAAARLGLAAAPDRDAAKAGPAAVDGPGGLADVPTGVERVLRGE